MNLRSIADIAKLLPFFGLMIIWSGTRAQTIQDLHFLSGYWRGTDGSTINEEYWSGNEGGLMVGMHKDLRQNGSTFFEFLRIEERDSGVVYLAQPGGKSPVSFVLKSVENQTATFENLTHDFPVRIIYQRKEDQLLVRIEDETGEKSINWIWTKSIF